MKDIVMTIGEFLQYIKGIPLASDIDICDANTGEHMDFSIDVTSNKDYESDLPIVTLYLNNI